MPLPEEPDKELSWRSEKTDTVKNKDGVYEFWWNNNHASKANLEDPQTPMMINGFWGDPQTLTFSC